VQQLSLPLIPTSVSEADNALTCASFSHGGVCPEDERLALEARYAGLLEETGEFNRRLVSYQGNKGEIVHGWIRYKEGFSAQLVETLIRKMGIRPGDTILEPFSGSATTLLIAKALGINAVGIEILPVCHLAWEAKSRLADYRISELDDLLRVIAETEPDPHWMSEPFPHLVITRSAFPAEVEHDLMFYTRWLDRLDTSAATKMLCRLALTSILEEISYTRKDGQYLRWDYRADKVQERNDMRASQGKKSIKKMDKGPLPTVKAALVRALGVIVEDIKKLQLLPLRESVQQLIPGSALEVLPVLEADQFHGVITSPPYCNRYDYTRTYALELAYLGVGEAEVRALRQSQLSCTVENRSKVDALKKHYGALGRPEAFEQIRCVVDENPVLAEINHALAMRWERGEINNRGVLSMVKGYFTELTFVFAELYRVCRSGAQVAFVNDNVRYGGEVIPVDLLSTDLAERLGFEPVQVYVLPQRKGNSSQQMGRFGRESLRKSITVWRKP